MSEEFRRAKRRKAGGTIDVVDSMTDEVIGRIGNLSESGMLLLALVPGVDDGLYQLRFRLASAHNPARTLEIGVHQLWSDPPEKGPQRWSGYRFIDISPADLAHLRRWVDEPDSEHV